MISLCSSRSEPLSPPLCSPTHLHPPKHPHPHPSQKSQLHHSLLGATSGINPPSNRPVSKNLFHWLNTSGALYCSSSPSVSGVYLGAPSGNHIIWKLPSKLRMTGTSFSGGAVSGAPGLGIRWYETGLPLKVCRRLSSGERVV